MKYAKAKMRVSSDPYFPVYNSVFTKAITITNTKKYGKYAYDSIHISENTGQRKPTLWHILIRKN